MFWDKKLLHKGKSIEEYNKVINILELNNIKYKDKVDNKIANDMSMFDKASMGSLSKKENFSYEYSIFVKKDDYDYAKSLIK